MCEITRSPHFWVYTHQMVSPLQEYYLVKNVRSLLLFTRCSPWIYSCRKWIEKETFHSVNPLDWTQVVYENKRCDSLIYCLHTYLLCFDSYGNIFLCNTVFKGVVHDNWHTFYIFVYIYIGAAPPIPPFYLYFLHSLPFVGNWGKAAATF